MPVVKWHGCPQHVIQIYLIEDEANVQFMNTKTVKCDSNSYCWPDYVKLFCGYSTPL